MKPINLAWRLRPKFQPHRPPIQNIENGCAPTDTLDMTAPYGNSTGIPVLRRLKSFFTGLSAPAVSQTGFLAPSIASVYQEVMTNLEHLQVRYVGERSATARIAVIDHFERADHGEMVVDVVRQKSGCSPQDILKVEGTTDFKSAPLLVPGPESPSQRLDAYIELSTTEELETKNKILRELSESTDIRTINMSLGHDTLGTADILFGQALRARDLTTPELRSFIFEACGLPASWDPSNLKALKQALVKRVHQVTRESRLVDGAKRKHEALSKSLKEKGVAYVLPSGNSGEHLLYLKGIGIEVPNGAHHSEFHNPHAIVVGAIDDRGTPTPDDDEMAPFSSSSPYTAFLANGTNVRVQNQSVDGTSFSAPVVAARLHQARQVLPEAPVEELGYLITRHARVPGSDIPVVE